MKLYGLRGFTHHGGRIITIMCDQGRAAALQAMTQTDGLRVHSAAQTLTQYHEISAGSVDALVQRYDIEVVARERWLALKARFGSEVYG